VLPSPFGEVRSMSLPLNLGSVAFKLIKGDAVLIQARP
jgi:hypothetical protein